MKKLFVSVPMKGRTEEEIKASIQKMKKIAEIYEGEELELIDSYIEDIHQRIIMRLCGILEKVLRNWHRQMYLLVSMMYGIGVDVISKVR